MGKRFWVYVLANRYNNVLYTGITNDLELRVFQHKIKLNKGFTSFYNCDKLVYFEEFGSILAAIRREKQSKKYRHAWKKELVESLNPTWSDLSQDWYDHREFKTFIFVTPPGPGGRGSRKPRPRRR